MVEIKSNHDDEFTKIISANLHTYNRSKCEWIRLNTESKPSKCVYHNFGVYEDDRTFCCNFIYILSNNYKLRF